MANFAIIEDQKVINIVLAENLADVPLKDFQIAKDVADTGAMIGWEYSNDTFVNPIPPFDGEIPPQPGENNA